MFTARPVVHVMIWGNIWLKEIVELISCSDNFEKFIFHNKPLYIISSKCNVIVRMFTQQSAQ